MTQAVALAQQASTGVSQGFKNRIINGAMVISQYNGTSSVSIDNTKNQYYIDRWAIQNNTGSAVFSYQQVTTAPTGFNNSLKITVTTADGALSATNKAQIYQPIEGFNFADLGWGTANAKTITISFWVQSSVTGTFGGALNNESTNRSYPFTYTISVANTWEQKSVTIAGDTTGTWTGATNGIGVYVNFSLGAGTTRSGTAGAWNSNWNTSATGATNLLATNGATLFLTGVQLEVGSTATSFEYLDYGRSLIQCQRYYQKTDVLGIGTTPSSTQIYMVIPFIVTMRAPPTSSVAGTTWALTDGYAGDANASSPTILGLDTYSTTSIRLQLGGFTGLTVGRVYFWRAVSTSLIGFSAEL
jgi:hypothetical protein